MEVTTAMKKLFGRKSASSSELPQNISTPQNSNQTHSERSESTEGTRVHRTDTPLTRARLLPDPEAQADTDLHSISLAALSESETLRFTREQCMNFQPTYQENFVSYLPYLVRRHRAEAAQLRLLQAAAGNGASTETNLHIAQNRVRSAIENFHIVENEGGSGNVGLDSDDDRTMVSQPDAPPLMQRYTTSYNHLRTLILASELIRNTIYVFPDALSFETFKSLRASSKKMRKDSIFIYDENLEIQRVYNAPVNTGKRERKGSFTRGNTADDRLHVSRQTSRPSTAASGSVTSGSTSQEFNLRQEAQNLHRLIEKHVLSEDSTKMVPLDNARIPHCKIDTRSHIIPLDYKAKGTGLPLFKIAVPYLSSFRRKTPYMIFRRYIEKPAPPMGSDADDKDRYETYDFCTVHLKNFQHYKRYIFLFAPRNAPAFKLVAFLNNYRPFTDFNYKDTRFRVFGSAMTMTYLTQYSPELKIHVLDNHQPSLMDNVVDKNTGRDTYSRGIRRTSNGTRNPESQVDASVNHDIQSFENPIVNPQNPLVLGNIDSNSCLTYTKCVPIEMPAFGRFLDACTYSRNTTILPKKYSEIGKIDIYQDTSEEPGADLSSTLSVDLDTLVLTSVALALRETNVRTTVKHPGQAHSTRMGLLNALALTGGSATGMSFA